MIRNWYNQIPYPEIGKELKKESIECQPWSSNTLDKSLSEVFDLFTARFFRLPLPFFPYTMRSRFTFSNFQERKHVKIRHFRNVTFVVNIIIKS